MDIWEKGQTRVACIIYNSGVIIQRKQHNSRTSTTHTSDMRWCTIMKPWCCKISAKRDKLWPSYSSLNNSVSQSRW